ncbi:MAG: hypothetical protein ACRYG7_01740 [Janthinobacterium lividum]
MSVQIIKWNKRYYEDLGTMDEDGLFDYAYCYFIYLFYFPGNYEVRVRRYTDTINECSIFLPAGNLKSQNVKEVLPKTTVLSAIVHFMKITQEVTQFNYFTGNYMPVYPTELENNLSDFSFVESIEKE